MLYLVRVYADRQALGLGDKRTEVQFDGASAGRAGATATGLNNLDIR